MQNRRRFTDRTFRYFNLVSRAAFLSAAFGGATLSISKLASAQAAQFPFPSTNVQAGNGRFTTTVLTPHELQAQYDVWVQRFIERCPAQGDARMRYPESGGDTRSEGVGYGMVIAAYMGDKATFDGLWDYYKRTSDAGTGLMHWRRDGCGGGGGGADTGSAADADIDAAFGLIVAERQWPNDPEDYGGDAATIIGDIRERLFQNGCPGLLLAGTQFAACGCINPSYIPPGYYPAFGEFEAGQAQFWTTARNNSYTYFNAASNNNTGLVPAWSQSSGATPEACPGQPQVSGGGNTNEFQADAARTPWRVATDFLWTGNAQAASFLQSIANFANTQRIVHIVDRYSLAGQPLNGNGQGANLDATGFRSTFTMGGFATAMIASSQEDLDEFTGAWQSMYLPGDSIGPNNADAPRAFNSSLALLYGLLVTGYMWDPLGPNPTAVPVTPPGPEGNNLLANGDFEEGFLGWTMENIGGPASEGFAMHLNGELHLLNQRVAGAPNQWQVRLSQTVPVQANQPYRISVRARADEPRLVRLVVAQVAEPFATYMGFDDQPDVEGASFTVDTEMRTYEIIAQSPVADNNARFTFELADDVAGLVIDDVVFETTNEPLRGLVDPETGEPLSPQNPIDNPGNPGTPGGNGDGTTPLGNGDGQVIPNQGDNTGGPGAPIPGGETGQFPAPPAGSPGGNGTCTTDANCGGFLCSETLGLCYEPSFGYVWDQSLNGGQGGWAQPPPHNCGAGFVFWPLSNACYDPETGYIFNPTTLQWEYYGDNYTQGQDDAGGSDSGCGIATSAPSGQSTPWFALGLLGLALGVRRRQARV